MKQLKLPQNPFLLFLPFLVLYIIIVLVFPTEKGTYGDEARYLIYARYMIDGFLPLTDLDFDYLGNGPGYPILLMPFVALHIPIIWIAIMNAGFLYFSIILLFKTGLKFLSFRSTFIMSLFWAFYFNSYVYIGKILPEIFTLFLVCLLIFNLVYVFSSAKSKKYIYFSGFIIGYIALTKPVFGYVLLCLFVGGIILWVLKREVKNYKTVIVILSIALATTTPYLIHTYNKTGKIFYWSSLGGQNLYWMTEKRDDYEYGSWIADHGQPLDLEMKNRYLNNFEERVKINHQKNFEEINKYKGIARDDAYKRIAINNIKSHPLNYLQNCISNVGRMLFNFPYSYKLQTPDTLLRLPFTGVIVVLMLFCIIPTFKNWRKIDFSIRFMLLIALTYFGGSILGSAETRMFTVIVPLLLCWLAYICERAFKIKLKFD